MNRNYAIDYFKFFAVFFVVCIHTAPFKGMFLWGINGSDINLILETFARFAVPFFFVASGFLFSNKLLILEETTSYFVKYFKKLLKLFLSWTLFYIMYGLCLSLFRAYAAGLNIKTELFNYVNNLIGLKSITEFILYGAVNAPASFHLWYLSALIWSLLIVYIFIKINKLRYLLIISLVLNIVGLFGQTYSGLFKLNIIDFPTRDALFFGLFYTSLGAFFACHHEKIKEKMLNIKSSILVWFFIIFSLTQVLERIVAELLWPKEIIATNYYFSTILVTICLFLFIIKNNQMGKDSRLSQIGENAVGIYVSHTVFINIISSFFSFLEIEVNKFILYHFLITPGVFVLGYFYYQLLQKYKHTIKIRFYNRIQVLLKKSNTEKKGRKINV
ncbi:acyltransferase family protein [Sutcliffiella horikoshii]|uniref:acyltransferase family protein n=1 Tax=Sutcliffiella horikoshii TaxID=79883 RepID=UPI00384BA811